MKHSLKTSLTVGALALAVVTTALPAPSAHAQSTSDLQAQITALLAQIQQLQAQTNNQSSVSVNLTRNLNVGMTGADVQALQRFLNSDPATQVAISGVGSKGNETMYFGPATQAAVIKYQNKYRTEILTPVGLSQGTGFVGASTRAHMNARGVVTTPTNPTTPSTPGQSGNDLQGEGDLDTFEIDAANDDTIRKASADSEIAVLTFEADNGDLILSRMDISLVAASGNTEKDPWDVFENISLWINGEKVTERDIDARTDFQDRKTGTVRISGLNIVLEEDEEVEMVIAVTVQNGVKDAGSNADWSITVDNLRYKDAQNVVTTDTSTGDLGNAVDFSIVERGDGEELKFKTTDNNPEEQTVVVGDKNRTNNVTVLGYSIEALGGDIELERLYVNIQTGTATFDDVVSDVRLKVGSKTFKKDDIVTTGNYSNNSVLVSFDIDKKVTIDEDDIEDITVLVDLKPTTKYTNGETIMAQITSDERDMTKAEGADDVESFSGSIVGKMQTLISEGVSVPSDSVKMSTKTLTNNSTIGEFKIEFEVEAVEGDFYIASQASTSSLATLGGVQYSVDTTSGTPTSLSAILDSTAKEQTDGVYVIREGRSETFTLIVTIDASAAGSHRVALEGLLFSSDTNGVTDGTTYNVMPKNKFRTGYQFINN